MEEVEVEVEAKEVEAGVEAKMEVVEEVEVVEGEVKVDGIKEEKKGKVFGKREEGVE